MRTHELKTLPEYFNEVWNGRKPFEVRKNDRDYKVGDRLILLEWSSKLGYSGREIETTVSYILKGGQFGIESGYAVLGLGNKVLPYFNQKERNA